jgi:UDP-N-acetylglucosamine--N-acetylmuramyl-(pentapeptide) pyrophosphoryl-undecaprenol N-acetylglucosamine transferase
VSVTAPPRVLMAAGGTAGHTSPMLATAAALRELAPRVAITCLGTPRGLETVLVPKAGYPLELVEPVPLPRHLSAEWLRLPVRLRATVSGTLDVVDRVRPDVVVGFGGYVSVPAYLAGRRRGVPLVVHEGNALPGLANRLGARLTPYVASSFPGTPLRGAVCTGLPVRTMISRLDRVARRPEARAHFGLRDDQPVLLVTGGSQGAQRLNVAVAGAAGALGAAGVQVLHVAGVGNDLQLSSEPGSPRAPYVVLPYVDRMDLAYAAADLVVCRAGASTVTEVAVLGLPAVFVPLPIGNGEQGRNAAPVVEAGGAVLVADADVDPAWVSAELLPLTLDAGRLRAMAQRATGVLPRHADRALAELVLDAAGVPTNGNDR